MSVQSGIMNWNGVPASRKAVLEMTQSLLSFGPDAEGAFVDGSVAISYRAFHTTPESRLACQPYVHGSLVLTWDGRLDNREDLHRELAESARDDQSDIALLAAAFERWDTGCFAKLKGDWAASIWCSKTNRLVLSRDYLGVKPLFYHSGTEKFLWCSHLAGLLLNESQFTPDCDYIAGYLTLYPDADLTPYQEIRAVPPASFVVVSERRLSIRAYWKFDSGREIRYRSDADYEEHYRQLFRQSVLRRLRSHAPVLAELSGGFDSSSIVCMADQILETSTQQPSTLETFSFYDATEPDEDDLRYLATVEKQRGRKGIHVDLQPLGGRSILDDSTFHAEPHFGDRSGAAAALTNISRNRGCRVLLAGTGGDEVNGQALDPRVLMAELFVQLRWIKLARELRSWSLLIRKRPWIHLLGQTLLQFAPMSVRAALSEQGCVAPFVSRNFSRRHRMAARQLGDSSDSRWLLPRQRDAAQTVAALSRRLSSIPPSVIEKRYPYLDQDLLEFLMAIPLGQLQRSGERRSLMRRAIGNILPPEVLNRNSKSRLGRCYCLFVRDHWKRLQELCSNSVVAQLGIVDAVRLRECLSKLKRGELPGYALPLLKTVAVEAWLAESCARKLIVTPQTLAKKPKLASQEPIECCTQIAERR